MGSIDTYLAVHANAIKLRSTRAELLAGNLANADTPGFRPQDFDFAKALEQSTSTSKPAIAATHPSHLPISSISPAAQTTFRDSPSGSLDENSVDSEFERAQFADNDIRYQASIQFVSQRIGSLIRAIRGE